MDQNSAFDLEVKENCPNGVVVYDLFHVLSNFGRKVIDRVRVDAANSLRHAPCKKSREELPVPLVQAP